jgi:hypothetical protein
VRFRGHFDGKAIVLDEKVILRPNQRVTIEVEDAAGTPGEKQDSSYRGTSGCTDFRQWVGLAGDQVSQPRFADDHDLWK